jgi:hypothetical protein
MNANDVKMKEGCFFEFFGSLPIYGADEVNDLPTVATMNRKSFFGHISDADLEQFVAFSP